MNDDNKPPTPPEASKLASDADLEWLTPEIHSKISDRFFGGKLPSDPEIAEELRRYAEIKERCWDIPRQEYETRWNMLLSSSQEEAQHTFRMMSDGEPTTTILASKRIAIAENIDRRNRLNRIARGEQLARFDMLPEDLLPDWGSLDKKLHHFRCITPRFIASLSGGRTGGSEYDRLRSGNDPCNFSVQRAVWEFQSREIGADSIDFAGAYLESSASLEVSVVNDQLGITDHIRQAVILKLPQDRYLTKSAELAMPLSYSDQMQRQIDEKFPVTDLYIPTRTHQIADNPFEPLVIVCGALTAMKVNAFRWHAVGLPVQLPKLSARLLPSVRESLYHFMRQVEIPGRVFLFAIDDVSMESRPTQLIVYETSLTLFSLGGDVRFMTLPGKAPLDTVLKNLKNPDAEFPEMMRAALPLAQVIPQRHNDVFLQCFARAQLSKITAKQFLRELSWNASPADIQDTLEAYQRSERSRDITAKPELIGPSADEYAAVREFLEKTMTMQVPDPSERVFIEDGDVWLRASDVPTIVARLSSRIRKERLYSLLQKASSTSVKLVGRTRRSADGKTHRYLFLPRDIFENYGVVTNPGKR